MKKELLIYVASDGNDENDGLSLEADKMQGPLATIQGAFDKIRYYRSGENQDVEVNQHGPGFFPGAAKIIVKGGRYFFDEPLILTSDDSAPIVVEPFEDEHVAFDGGVQVLGWQEDVVNGVRCWFTSIPGSFEDFSDINQMFVNGKRAVRPRYPESGLFSITDPMSDQADKYWSAKSGSLSFKYVKGELKQLKNLQDVEVVAMHYWIEEHLRIKSLDEEALTAELLYSSFKPLTGGWGSFECPYYLENVFENLKNSGQFYVDSTEGKIFYIPREGESIAESEVIVPKIPQLIYFNGDASRDQLIKWITFENISFEHTLNMWPGDNRFVSTYVFSNKHTRLRKRGGTSQGAVDIPGVIYMEGVDSCSFENCTFSGLGWYAIEVERGCQNIRLIGNNVQDCLAGGFKINGANANEPIKELTGNIRITDNNIYDIGIYYHSAIGVFARNTYNTLIAHNSIHDLYYSAISVGWMWGYRPSVCKNNIIEYNHLYNIGKGLLSDMGGVYTLGPQPGTEIRNNLVHDIRSAHYGGWAIYPDEGSSQVIIENNICYNCNCSGFHQHYGKENIIRNNIFAFGDESIIALSKKESHLSFTLQRNILLADSSPIYCEGYGYSFDDSGPLPFDSSMNLIWDLDDEIKIAKTKTDTADVVQGGAESAFTVNEWLNMGYDRFSVFKDPLFKDPKNGDFSLPADSPAYDIGFKAIDMSTVGPRR